MLSIRSCIFIPLYLLRARFSLYSLPSPGFHDHRRTAAASRPWYVHIFSIPLRVCVHVPLYIHIFMYISMHLHSLNLQALLLRLPLLVCPYLFSITHISIHISIYSSMSTHLYSIGAPPPPPGPGTHCDRVALAWGPCPMWSGLCWCRLVP